MIDLHSRTDPVSSRWDNRPEPRYQPYGEFRFPTAETHELSEADPSPGAPASHTKPPPPLFADRFQLLKKLNEGGQGAVYLAYDEQLQRNVAVKISHSETPNDSLQFSRTQREGVLLAKFNHPFLPKVYESGFCQDAPYLVLEYVEGKHLGEISRPLSDRQIERFLQEIATAVSVVHQASILHLDLKPENVIVTPEGHCKLIDFGVAWIRNEADCRSIPLRCGTPGFMSPEQLAGTTADWTPETDVFGLGAILHFLLQGCPPLKDETISPCEAEAELNSVLSRLASDRKSPRLSRLCSRALHPDPQSRIATAEEFARIISRPLRLLHRSFAIVLFACGVLLLWLGMVSALQSEASSRLEKSELPSPRSRLQLREVFLKFEVQTESSEAPRVAIWSPGLGFHEVRGLQRNWKDGKYLWSPRTRNGRMVTRLEDDVVAIVVLQSAAEQSPFAKLFPENGPVSERQIGPETSASRFFACSGSPARANTDSSFPLQKKSEHPCPYFCLISKAPERKGEIWALAAEIDLPGQKATLLPIHFQSVRNAVKRFQKMN